MITPTPRTFWRHYAETLKERGNPGAYEAYKGSSSWTKEILPVAECTLARMGFIERAAGLSSPQYQREYFKIDLIGYTTSLRTGDTDKQYDWELKIAYEHENQDDWDGELCKLCHVVADLRVISAYYEFGKGECIEHVLERKLRILGMYRLHRVPNSYWLFVFGPGRSAIEEGYCFRAFTIDSQLQVIDITGDQKVVPNTWAKA